MDSPHKGQCYNVIMTTSVNKVFMIEAVHLFHQLITPQPSGLEGYCRHGPGGRAGGQTGGRAGGRAVGRAAARLAEPISL